MTWIKRLAIPMVFGLVMGSVVYLAGKAAQQSGAAQRQDTLELDQICRTTQRTVELATAWLADPARVDVAKTVITTLAPIRATCDHRPTP